MSTRLSALIIVLILMHIVLAACAQNHDDIEAPHAESAALKPGPGQVVAAEIPKATVEAPAGGASTSDWLPGMVTLTCSLPSCLPQVGVVIFATPVVGQR